MKMLSFRNLLIPLLVASSWTALASPPLRTADVGRNDGEILWYRCSLTQAEGQWAITNYPMQLDIYYGSTLQKDSHGFAIHWQGHFSMSFRDGSDGRNRVSLYAADFSANSSDDPFNGTFPVSNMVAKSDNPSFQFVDRTDPKTGWHIDFELTYIQDKGVYDCQLAEPYPFPGH